MQNNTGGTVNSSWCRMPQHSKLNFAIKHKAWHYIDNSEQTLNTGISQQSNYLLLKLNTGIRKNDRRCSQQRASHSKISMTKFWQGFPTPIYIAQGLALHGQYSEQTLNKGISQQSNCLLLNWTQEWEKTIDAAHSKGRPTQKYQMHVF